MFVLTARRETLGMAAWLHGLAYKSEGWLVVLLSCSVLSHSNSLVFVSRLERMGHYSSLCVLLLVLLAGDVLARQDTRREKHSGSFKDLEPQEPRVEFESEGGRLEAWGGRGSGVFEEANVAACRTTLKRRGLWLPSYVDSPGMQLVTRGSGRVGIISSVGDQKTQATTFKVEKGDIVALPEGVAIWWYNDREEDLEIFGAADVTLSPRAGGVRAFHLAGGKARKESEQREGQQEGYGAVLHGFNKETLGRAWNMDQNMVQELLESQTEIGIVRVDEDIKFSDEESESENTFAANFIYRLAKAHPDIRVENGGELRQVHSEKFPVLRYLGLGMECMQLQQGAMVSPNWFHNAHQVLYVLEGNGKLEIASNNGEKALETRLHKGSVVVIPELFPSSKIASDNEHLHYISVVTSHRPSISYMAGRNSVYQGIPTKVLSRMFKVDEEKASRIQHAHEKQSVIFPRKQDAQEDERRKQQEDERKQHEEERRKQQEEEERRKHPSS